MGQLAAEVFKNMKHLLQSAQHSSTVGYEKMKSLGQYTFESILKLC
jgi:hypothetical protein